MKKYRAVFCLVLLMFAILGVSLFCIGCEAPMSEEGGGIPTSNLTETQILEEQEPIRKLRMKVVTGDSWEQYPKDAQEGSFILTHSSLESVDILLGEERMPLETALETGMVTMPQLWAWAMEDSENRFCREQMETRNGFTEFYYLYSDFDLCFLNDVLEAPNGEDYLIRRVEIRPPHSLPSMGRRKFESENGEPLSREDWGLTLESQKADAKGISITATQVGGQQLGQLQTNWYFLRKENGETIAHGPWQAKIKMDGTTTLRMDWTEVCGELPAGKYSLSIAVEDDYDRSILSHMVRNFYDEQMYGFYFTIPET